jgi:peptidoglycan/xylan/chitin deacetylase (PgdA/CDA1 family)
VKLRSIFWHNVIPDSSYHQCHDIIDPTVSTFREQIKFICENHTPISIYDFMRIVGGEKSADAYKKPPVLLGFDDGFKNVVTCALPVLREFDVPAVFFVLGEVLHNPDFVPWYVEVKHMLRRTEQETLLFDNESVHLGSHQEQRKFRKFIGQIFKACNSEERQALLTRLAKSLNVSRPKAYELDENLRFISKDDLSVLNTSTLLTVASHAMTHRNLGSLSYGEQVYELEESDAELRNHFINYYPVISYPDGSFSQDTIAIAKRIYKFGFAVFQGSSYRNHYAYPRYSLANETLEDLKYTLSSVRLNLLLPFKKLICK